MIGLYFTSTESRLMNVLKDGEPHDRPELLACLLDSQATMDSIHIHLSRIRKKIRPLGHLILCEYINRKHYYRHVRRIKCSSKE